jgi:hypothetical protein
MDDDNGLRDAVRSLALHLSDRGDSDDIGRQFVTYFVT